MKLKMIVSLLLTFSMLIAITACDSSKNQDAQTAQSTAPQEPAQINIYVNGGSIQTTDGSNEGKTFAGLIRTIPTKEGYVFAGWYSDEALTDYIIPTHITTTQYSKGTAYAKWISVEPITYTVREETATITDSGRAKQRLDVVEFRYDFNLVDLERAGYTRLRFTISYDVKEVNDGYQYIFLYKDRNCIKQENFNLLDYYSDFIFGEQNKEDPTLLDVHEYEHGPGNLDTSWETVTFTKVIEIDNLIDNLYLRYGASGSNDDDWQNKNIIVTVTPEK